MNDFTRSVLLISGITAGLLAGLHQNSAAPSPASLESATEIPVPAPAAQPPLTQRLADWWLRALELKPGETEPLLLEIEAATGPSLLPTFITLAARRDPEACLRTVLHLRKSGTFVGAGGLFQVWAATDPVAAARAAADFPDGELRRVAQRRVTETIDASGVPPPSPPPRIELIAERLRRHDLSAFAALEALPREEILAGLDSWVDAATNMDSARTIAILATLGPDGYEVLENAVADIVALPDSLTAALSTLPDAESWRLRRIRAQREARIRSPEDNASTARRLPPGDPQRIGLLRGSVLALPESSDEARRLAESTLPGELSPAEFRHAGENHQANDPFAGLRWLADLNRPAARRALTELLVRFSATEQQAFVSSLPPGETREACIRRLATEDPDPAWLRSLTESDYAAAADATSHDLTVSPRQHAIRLQRLTR